MINVFKEWETLLKTLRDKEKKIKEKKHELLKQH